DGHGIDGRHFAEVDDQPRRDRRAAHRLLECSSRRVRDGSRDAQNMNAGVPARKPLNLEDRSRHRRHCNLFCRQNRILMLRRRVFSGFSPWKPPKTGLIAYPVSVLLESLDLQFKVTLPVARSYTPASTFRLPPLTA